MGYTGDVSLNNDLSQRGWDGGCGWGFGDDGNAAAWAKLAARDWSDHVANRAARR